jgi:hypothetical protein
MQTDICSLRNELVRFEVIRDFSAEMKSALARFFRHMGSPQALCEIIEPLMASSKPLFVAAISDRPWPPRGVGAHTIESLAIAVIGEGNRAFLTPVLTTPQNATNIGLASAVTKTLFETLHKESIESVIYVVRTDSTLAAQILRESGFDVSGERVVTENANFVHFSACPAESLERLGLSDIRLGDLLSLSIEPSRLSKLALYHLGLSAAIQNYWSDRLEWVELLPGLIDWVATLPPGGIGGTSGPGGLPGEIGSVGGNG